MAINMHLDHHGDFDPVILTHLGEKLVQGELWTSGMHLEKVSGKVCAE